MHNSTTETSPAYSWQSVKSPKLDLSIVSLGHTKGATPEPYADIGGDVHAIPGYIAFFLTPGNTNLDTRRVTKSGLENALLATGIVEAVIEARNANPKFSGKDNVKLIMQEIQESFDLSERKQSDLYWRILHGAKNAPPRVEHKEFFDAAYATLSGMDDTPSLARHLRPAARRA